MKLMIILSVVACACADKLDKTYLPPNSAQTADGSAFLQTPISGSDRFRDNGRQNGFTQNGNSFGQNGNGFAQNQYGVGQNRNAYAQNGNGFQNGNTYAQNGNGNAYAQNRNGFAQNDFARNGIESFNGNYERQERPQAAYERNAAILRQDSENDGESYAYAYETENGIVAEEKGVATNGVEAQGGYSYVGDDGKQYSISYTADQNGFQPQGDHLPTPHPIPEEILRALEQNARDEANGIFDDGSYDAAKYGDESAQNLNGNYGSNGFNGNGNYGNNGFNGNGNYADNGYNGNVDDTVVTNSALFNGRFRSQGLGNQGGQNFAANKAYLPPQASQRSSNFGRRQGSYNARTGYQY